MPLVVRGHLHAVAPYLPPMSEADMMARFGGPPAKTFATLLGDPGRAAEAVRRFEDYHAAHADEVRLFVGARALLDALRRRGHALALWTGRDRASTEQLLATHGLAGLVDTMVCGDDLPTHKPDSAGMREILQRLGRTADETLYVGDAEADVQAGVAAGVRTLFIRHGREVVADLLAQAWCVTETPEAAYAAVVAAAG